MIPSHFDLDVLINRNIVVKFVELLETGAEEAFILVYEIGKRLHFDLLHDSGTEDRVVLATNLLPLSFFIELNVAEEVVGVDVAEDLDEVFSGQVL